MIGSRSLHVRLPPIGDVDVTALGPRGAGILEAPSTVRVLRGGDPSLVLVEVAGEVDGVTAPGVLTAIHAELDGDARTVVVDLSGVRFCGAAGLRSLARARAYAQGLGSEVYLAALSSTVARLLAHARREGVDPQLPTWPETLALPRRSRTSAPSERSDGYGWFG